METTEKIVEAERFEAGADVLNFLRTLVCCSTVFDGNVRSSTHASGIACRFHRNRGSAIPARGAFRFHVQRSPDESFGLPNMYFTKASALSGGGGARLGLPLIAIV